MQKTENRPTAEGMSSRELPLGVIRQNLENSYGNVP